MSICDKILIVVSVFNCLLSVFAVYLVRQGVKRKQKIRARKNSRIALTNTSVLVLVSAARNLSAPDHQETIQVKGKLKDKNFEIA